MPAKKEEAKEIKEVKEVKESKQEKEEVEVIEVEVEQNVERPAVYSTLYFEGRVINFENGKAKIDSELAKTLRKLKYIK